MAAAPMLTLARLGWEAARGRTSCHRCPAGVTGGALWCSGQERHPIHPTVPSVEAGEVLRSTETYANDPVGKGKVLGRLLLERVKHYACCGVTVTADDVVGIVAYDEAHQRPDRDAAVASGTTVEYRMGPVIAHVFGERLPEDADHRRNLRRLAGDVVRHWHGLTAKASRFKDQKRRCKAAVQRAIALAGMPEFAPTEKQCEGKRSLWFTDDDQPRFERLVSVPAAERPEVFVRALEAAGLAYRRKRQAQARGGRDIAEAERAAADVVDRVVNAHRARQQEALARRSRRRDDRAPDSHRGEDADARRERRLQEDRLRRESAHDDGDDDDDAGGNDSGAVGDADAARGSFGDAGVVRDQGAGGDDDDDSGAVDDDDDDAVSSAPSTAAESPPRSARRVERPTVATPANRPTVPRGGGLSAAYPRGGFGAPVASASVAAQRGRAAGNVQHHVDRLLQFRSPARSQRQGAGRGRGGGRGYVVAERMAQGELPEIV